MPSRNQFVEHPLNVIVSTVDGHWMSIHTTLVGFWSPGFAPALAIPGYHLHALTDDRSQGGHVFDVRARTLRVEVHRVSDLRVVFPDNEAFLEADLTPDAAEALGAVERPG